MDSILQLHLQNMAMIRSPHSTQLMVKLSSNTIIGESKTMADMNQAVKELRPCIIVQNKSLELRVISNPAPSFFLYEKKTENWSIFIRKSLSALMKKIYICMETTTLTKLPCLTFSLSNAKTKLGQTVKASIKLCNFLEISSCS